MINHNFLNGYLKEEEAEWRGLIQELDFFKHNINYVK